MTPTITLIQKLKKQAKGRARTAGIPYHAALDAVAVEAGFHHWADVARRHKDYLAGRGIARQEGGAA